MRKSKQQPCDGDIVVILLSEYVIFNSINIQRFSYATLLICGGCYGYCGVCFAGYYVGGRHMSKKKILTKIVLMVIVILLVICGIITIYRLNTPKENALTFCLPDIDGNSHWDYELSNSSILKVTEDKRYMNIEYIYNYWVFEPIGSGEVTIFFYDKKFGEIIEEHSFSITYYIEEDGNIEEVSGNNKPEMTNIKDDMTGYIGIKVHDFIYCTIVKFVFGVIEIFS